MHKRYKLSLHIFRRDLRLIDNTALREALESSESVIPCFIFDKRQIEDNAYKSSASLQFMAKSLQELDEALKQKGSKLYCFYGIAEEIIEQILSEKKIEAVYVNRDYTPFSIARDAVLETLCIKHSAIFRTYNDALLNEPEDIFKKDGTPFTIFTYFMRRAKYFHVREPETNRMSNYFKGTISNTNTDGFKKLLKLNNPNLAVKGGRNEGLKLLKAIHKLTDYDTVRNIPALDGTTHLSAHHKFGTVSIRETFSAILNTFNHQHSLITECYWRDFFTHIAFHFPHVFAGAYHEKYNKIKWKENKKHLRAWCEGMTGFPIVDAGMRELNTTGYMHNRVRMITASFLCKDLHLDWHLGEKYFAQQLVDYDAAVNNGNWQWAASTGCDAQPYFRIFNPWLQQAKFDPDCLYIKKWIPELAHISPKSIHKLATDAPDKLTNYPRPIVDHSKQRIIAKDMYKSV